MELDKLCGTWSPEVKAATLTSQKAGQTLSLGWARLDSLAPIYVMIQDASFFNEVCADDFLICAALVLVALV